MRRGKKIRRNDGKGKKKHRKEAKSVSRPVVTNIYIYISLLHS